MNQNRETRWYFVTVGCTHTGARAESEIGLTKGRPFHVGETSDPRFDLLVADRLEQASR